MTVELLPYPADELASWLDHMRNEYRDDRVKAGDDLATATRKADESNKTYFPDGKPAAGHALFAVVTEGRRLGLLWVGPHPDGIDGVAWVWDIELSESERGKGFGRSTMVAAEEWARSHGYASLALNVFGFNTVARRLYESLGYETTAVQMRKAL